MRKFPSFLLFFFLLLFTCSPAFAFDEYVIQSDTESSDVAIAAILEALHEAGDGGYYHDFEIMPLYSLDNGTTSINTGLRSVLQGVIGNYSPVVVQYQYTNGTNTQYLREILPDYEWMISAAIFAMLVWCTFRLGGNLICRK